MNRIALMTVLVIGCASSEGSTDADATECEPPEGLYRATYTPTDDGCELGIYDELEVFGGNSSGDVPPPGCIDASVPVDGCRVDFERACTDADTGQTLTLVGSVRWEMGDGAGFVVLTLDSAAGDELCMTEADVMYVRQ